MVSVKKEFESPPNKLKSEECKELIKLSINEQSSHKYKSSFYNKGSIDELKRIYSNKCCYCETDISAGSPWDVDHFRPKKFGPNVAGYYWLGYEWTNLLLSCKTCNNWKNSKFPIEDENLRVKHPSLDANGLPIEAYLSAKSQILLNEIPLLINPEIESPDDHFYVLPNGELKSFSNKGEITIDVCKLNRERLLLKRKQLIVRYFQKISNYYLELNENKIQTEEFIRNIKRHFGKLLNNFSNIELEYSFCWNFIIIKFDIFCDEYLRHELAELTKKYFNEYIGYIT